MKVQGIDIPDSVVAAGREWLATRDASFTSHDFRVALLKAGCPQPPHNWVCERLADRLLQQARKAGLVRFQDGLWSVVGKPAQ